MRAVSRTTLSLGDLLEIPISICAATGSNDVKFPSGWRKGTEPDELEPEAVADPDDEIAADLEAALEDEDEGVEPVAVKGVKVGNHIAEVPDSELEWAAAVSQLGRVEVLEVCDYRQVPTDRLAGSFWIQPDPAFDKPLATLMAAMRQMKRAMIVKYTVKSRQRLGVIRVRKTGNGPQDLAFLLNAVVYSAEWRKPDKRVLAPAAALAEVDPRAVQHAVALLTDLAGDGSSIDEATDRLIVEHEQIAENAIGGRYESPAEVLKLAAELAERPVHAERAHRLMGYLAERWPDFEAQREQAVAILAEGGDDVKDRLAALAPTA